ESRAAASADSRCTRYIAWILGSQASTRASTASSASTGDTSPPRNAAAIRAALQSAIDSIVGRRNSARQIGRSHQELVDRARALAAFADRPHDQRLAPAHVAGREHLR